MKSKIIGLLSLAVFIFIFTSGIFEELAKFLMWLVSLNSTKSEISIAGERFVKVATFVISYTVVGIIFNKLRLFDKDIMKFAYFVISTLVSFGLCYIVMLLEKYIVIIAIVVLIIVLLGTGIAICMHYRKEITDWFKRKK